MVLARTCSRQEIWNRRIRLDLIHKGGNVWPDCLLEAETGELAWEAENVTILAIVHVRDPSVVMI